MIQARVFICQSVSFATVSLVVEIITDMKTGVNPNLLFLCLSRV